MQNKLRLVSWNVNGLRACLRKGFAESMQALSPDVVCLQEIKMREGQANPGLAGFHEFYNSAEKAGYSGTALLSRVPPLSVSRGIGVPEHDREGRVLSAEFDAFILVTVYSPNSQDELKRLPYRMDWEDAFRTYISALAARKPVVICGDMNVAHREIDLRRPRENRRNPGFTDEEREKFTALLNTGIRDIYRDRNPDKTDAYTWWSYRANARQNNTGWRIDYFLVSEALSGAVLDAEIHSSIEGSDHCPVSLLLNL